MTARMPLLDSPHEDWPSGLQVLVGSPVFRFTRKLSDKNACSFVWHIFHFRMFLNITKPQRNEVPVVDADHKLLQPLPNSCAYEVSCRIRTVRVALPDCRVHGFRRFRIHPCRHGSGSHTGSMLRWFPRFPRMGKFSESKKLFFSIDGMNVTPPHVLCKDMGRLVLNRFKPKKSPNALTFLLFVR